MRQCPDCQKWTLDYDDYFGRFRCFNPECGWMPASSTEREIQLLKQHEKPQLLSRIEIDDPGLAFTAFYDSVNDALLFDFGLDEQSFDVPEGDGVMIWKVGQKTGSVSGFTILGAQKFAPSKIQVDIDARKENVERAVRAVSHPVASGRATRVLIEKVSVTAHPKGHKAPHSRAAVGAAFKNALKEFEARFLEHEGPPREVVLA